MQHSLPPDAGPTFGFRNVRSGEKPQLVGQVFSSVARRYDVMNDLMSLGLHRLWKSAFVDQARPRRGEAILDVAGGTGDIAFAIRERLRGLEKPEIEFPPLAIVDASAEMLAVGQERATAEGVEGEIHWIEGDALALPFADSHFDLYTIAFGLRNVENIEQTLREAARVLKPGGRFYCLEFSRLILPEWQRPYQRYRFDLLPKLGNWVAGDAEAYRYLAESIERFPHQEALLALLKKAGFFRAQYQNLSTGIAAIHWGWKV